MRIRALSHFVLCVAAPCGGAQNQRQGLPLIDPANPLPEVFNDAQISLQVNSAACYGYAYSTWMAIIALAPRLKILPIYQR